MSKVSFSALLLLGFLLVALSNGQSVECIKQIYSSYANVNWCESTSSDVRPINATSSFKVMKNMSWYGFDDWDAYILRNGYFISNLLGVVTCFSSEPIPGKFYAGKSYQLAIKCTDLPFVLAKKDLIYFDIFTTSSHKVAQLAYAIPIPGFSTPQDAVMSEEQVNSLKEQAASFRMKRIRKEAQIRVEEEILEQ